MLELFCLCWRWRQASVSVNTEVLRSTLFCACIDCKVVEQYRLRGVNLTKPLELDFDFECHTLGLACARAKLRLDPKAPAIFRDAYQGYRGLRAFPSYYERKWLSLRLSAIKRGMVLALAVNAAFLEQITPKFCPVTLEALDTGSKTPNNPSVDRLVNEGTYAAGNLCMFSIRANQAKADMNFEDVAKIATTMEAHGKLKPIEWMRLASLMYGAWCESVGAEDPHIVPFVTYPSPNLFTTQSQTVQWLLLRHCRAEVWPDSLQVWLAATHDAGGSVDEFMQMASSMKAALELEEYPPSAWYRPAVFKPFAAWYLQSKECIRPLLEARRDKYQSGVDTADIVARWKVGSRYQI